MKQFSMTPMLPLSTKHFSLSTHETSYPSSTKAVLLILDIQHTVDTHAAIIHTLQSIATVYCMEINNLSVSPESFHWNPASSDIQSELYEITKSLPVLSVCIGQGLGARLLEWLPIHRTHDLLCNPTFPTAELSVLNWVTYVLNLNTAGHTQWFNNLIRQSWIDALPFPTNGPAPWIASDVERQTLSGQNLTNGTWRSIFQIVLTQPKWNSNDHILLMGSESPTVETFTAAKVHSYCSGSQCSYKFFSGQRQELLLAEHVQQDILQFCKELT